MTGFVLIMTEFALKYDGIDAKFEYSCLKYDWICP